jgi:hypothetical protein
MLKPPFPFPPASPSPPLSQVRCVGLRGVRILLEVNVDEEQPGLLAEAVTAIVAPDAGARVATGGCEDCGRVNVGGQSGVLPTCKRPAPSLHGLPWPDPSSIARRLLPLPHAGPLPNALTFPLTDLSPLQHRPRRGL